MSTSTIGRSSHMLAFEQLDPADVGEPVVELLVMQVWVWLNGLAWGGGGAASSRVG